MRKKHTAQLRRQITSKRRISVSGPARRSPSEGGFLNLCIFVGLLVLVSGVILATSPVTPSGRGGRRNRSVPSLAHDSFGALPGGTIIEGAEGGTCQYTITSGTDAIVPGITDIGNHCVNCGTLITLPFSFVLYDQTFKAVTVSATGRLSFACNNEPGCCTTSCLPAPPATCPYDFTIFPLWHDWNTSPGSVGCSRWDSGCGVFTSVSGTAPNRIFNIEWRVAWNNNNIRTGNFEVRLYENGPNKRFDVIYGYSQDLPGNGDTAGVQGAPGFFTQNFCDGTVPPNSRRTYSCVPPTPTPSPTPTTVVTNTNDSGPGSLRQALADANNGSTINFDPSLNGQRIMLTSDELVIDKNVTINGPGPNLLGVYRSSQTSFRVVHVIPATTVTISGLTISGGSSDQRGGGGILNDHAILTLDSCIVQNSVTAQFSAGGGIYNDGSGGSATLTILNSTVIGNSAYSAGGGIYNDADNGGIAAVSLTNSSLNGNIAAYNEFPAGGGVGGGIYNSGGTLTITNSAVSNNTAGVSDPFPLGNGGGIASSGTVTITNSTISGNQGYSSGGGIENAGTLTIDSSTVSGNGASGQHDGQPWGRGGGISGSVTFTNSTLSGNFAALSGGGIDGAGTVTNSTISDNNGGGISANGTLEIGNTVLKAAARGANISNNGGTVISHGYNLSSDDGGGYLTGPGDQINTDPLLGLLQNNGGLTATHALLPDSPAVDAGDPNFTPPPNYDQRGPGFERVFNDRIDIGSFEAQPTPTPTPRCNQYGISEGIDIIVPGTTDTGNHCIWCSTLIDLPFSFVLYGRTFNTARVTSSGRLDFVCNNEPASFNQTCLPAAPYDCPYDFTIFALWHEWSTSVGEAGCSTWANGCGIFTSTSGTAPNRIFNIEWHVTRRSNSQDAGNFEVRLYENDPKNRFDVIYGAISGVSDEDSAGVQGPTDYSTQDFCNVLAPKNVSRSYTTRSCPTVRATPAPRPRPPPAPRP